MRSIVRLPERHACARQPSSDREYLNDPPLEQAHFKPIRHVMHCLTGRSAKSSVVCDESG